MTATTADCCCTCKISLTLRIRIHSLQNSVHRRNVIVYTSQCWRRRKICYCINTV